MRQITFRVPSPNFNLILTSDTHEGARSQDESGVARIIDFIGSGKNNFFAFLGDEIEAITIDDKRYSPAAYERYTPDLQAKAVVNKFKPIRKKGVIWMDGNHPLKLWKHGMITRDDVAKPLGIPWGTYTAIVDFQDKYGSMFKSFMTHGYGTLRSAADDPLRRLSNMKLQLKRKLASKVGDCQLMAMGHAHKLLVAEPEPWLTLTSENGKLHQSYAVPVPGPGFIHPDHRWYVCSGGFLKTYSADGEFSGYPEVMGLDPVELGAAVVRVRDRKIVSIERMTV
jgi:hypothetical protein